MDTHTPTSNASGRRSPRASLRARSLPGSRREPALRRFASPARLLSLPQSSGSAETDAPLYALLALAGGDRLAGRLCLQAILPALKAQAVRIAHAPTAATSFVRSCSPTRGRPSAPTPPAGRTAWPQTSCSRCSTTRRGRLRRLTPPASAPRGDSGVPEPIVSSLAHTGEVAARRPGRALGVEGLLAAAVAAAEIDRSDAELILLTRVDGVPLRRVAASRGCSRDALLKRRQRAEGAAPCAHRARGRCPKSARFGRYLR